jgi:crotonobetainyl-CoA:carnitine CoA-transferase CaiB-like acyl-CoA transferase
MTGNQHPQPLSDIRVIDLSQGIAGPYSTKLLADFGADVIKVERPGSGDYARRLGPFPGDVSHPEKSGIFLHLNTDKRGITLDLKTAEGVDALKGLVKGVEILIESFKPGVMDRLGLDYDTLAKINPNLVMTSVSNFGQTGPYRDYKASDLIFYGMGGRMHASGLPERYPLKLGGNHAQYQAGNVAAMASMFAWYGQRHGTIGGQHIDVSIFETQMASYNSRMPALLAYQYTGERGRRLGGIRLGYPSGFYPCLDGYINVQGGGAFWPRTIAMLGMPELLEDPRFLPPMGQMDPDAREEFESTIWLPWVLERTKREVVEQCQAFEILSGAVNTIEEVMDNNPQFDARGYWVNIDHPEVGTLRYPGAPIYTQERWWRIRRPAPLLGQHTEEVLREELESTPAPTSSMAAASSQGTPATGKRPLPLEGLRVLDMTMVFAGPYGTMFLADMGAEVIRVESINVFPTSTRGQFARPSKEAEEKAPTSRYPNRDPGARPWNRVGMFNAHSRNKYSVTADLHTPEGKDVFRRLVEVSDVFVENIALGAMARLGLDYPVLSQWNPRLIMISSVGMGQTGPWAHFRGFGSHFEALYGHASVTGYPDMDVEGAPASVAADAATGVAIGLATVMALHQRKTTGKGTHVDLSQGENFVPHLGELFMDYVMNSRVAGPNGNRDPVLVQGAYPCAGDDEWVAISIGRIEQWHALCGLMGKPELVEDSRFEDMAGLRANHDEVDRIIGAWTPAFDPMDVFNRLQKEGIIAGPLLHEPLAYADPHLKDRNFFVPITHSEIGTHLYPSTAFKMSKVPFEVRKPPVRLGEDNDYVYRDVLGFTEEEYDHLKSLGQIGMDYAPHIK